MNGDGFRDLTCEHSTPYLGRLLLFGELFRLELHGPADELDKLREPLAELNPEFFAHVTGVAN